MVSICPPVGAPDDPQCRGRRRASAGEASMKNVVLLDSDRRARVMVRTKVGVWKVTDAPTFDLVSLIRAGELRRHPPLAPIQSPSRAKASSMRRFRGPLTIRATTVRHSSL